MQLAVAAIWLAFAAIARAQEPAAGQDAPAQEPAATGPDDSKSPDSKSPDPTPPDPDRLAAEHDLAATDADSPPASGTQASPAEDAGDASEAGSAPESTTTDADPFQTLSAAELAELGFESSAPSADTDLQLSGFIDFGTQIPLNELSRAVSPYNHPSFAIGNLNLYLSKNLTESLRTMVEVRFLFLPNGSGQFIGDTNITSTETTDDAIRLLRHGLPIGHACVLRARARCARRRRAACRDRVTCDVPS